MKTKPSRGSRRAYPVDLPPEPADAGQPIERFLRRRLAADPPHVQKLLRQGRVLSVEVAVDGGVTTLRAGDVTPAAGGLVRVAAATETAPPQPNRRIRLSILHEDDDLIVLDKPSGLATHPGPRHGTDTLLNALIARYPEMVELGRRRNFGLVHRLDLETSGVMLAARTAEAHETLVRAFADRRIDKRYAAFVDARSGRVAPGVIETKIDGKDARTDVEPVERIGPVAWLSLRPHTGRMHQIRIHLRDVGWPVLQDGRYGAGPNDLTAAMYLKRLALHAERIHLLHPRTGLPLSFEVSLPRDLRHSWKRARKRYGDGDGE